MKKSLQLSFLSICLATGMNAQAPKTGPDPMPPVIKRCGTEVPSKEWDEAFNKSVEEFKKNMASGRSAATAYTIPVIVHVIHGGQNPGNYPNISQTQINSQINVLNADFAGTGQNVNNLAATAFSAVGASNTEIRFCLATKNPLGQTLAEPGIDRVNYVSKGWSNPGSFGTSASFRSYMDNTVKPATIWDPTYYFNIWVSDENINAVQLLGYATFPANAGLAGIVGGGNASNDGIYVYAACFGNTGFVTSPYHLGRTASHEVGHYLGLRHIGGDGNNNVSGDCNASDFCADTPPQRGGFSGGQYGQNYGSPPYPLFASGSGSCSGAPNGNMFMNFMDYCDDGALYMFTPDQKTRMQTAMSNADYRKLLGASGATLCTNSLAAPVAAVIIDSPICDTLASITPSNHTTGNPIPTFSWSASPSSGVTFSPGSTAEKPAISFPSAGIYSITLEATNSQGSNSTVVTIQVDACAVGLSKHYNLMGHVSLQPNPSNGKFSVITVLPVSQDIEISVNNALGQQIMTHKYNGVTNGAFSVDMSQYANGIYFVTIGNGEEKIVKRLVLSK